MNCLWCLLWTMCDACNVYFSGVRYTWQRGLLPSARVKTLGKANTWQISMHSGTKMASLSSVCAVTLGKEANICTFWSNLCRVSSIWHSTKKAGLLSVRDLTLGKEGRFAECQVQETQQTRRDHLHAVTLLFFAERRFQLSAKYLLSVR